MPRHTLAKPRRHKCEHPGCSRSYIRREHLLRHARDHANRRPFTCSHCPSRFNRRDTLNRHITLNHEGSAHNPEPNNSDDQDVAGGGITAILEEVPPRNLTSHVLDLDFSSSPATQLLQSPKCRHLQNLYFSELHPHWPILHRHAFLNTPQPSELSQIVLVAGLWMSNDVESRAQARLYHNWLLAYIEKRLFHLETDPHRPQAPRPEFLPGLQTLLLTLILAAYRGTECIPLALIYNKLLVDIFKGTGVYEQQRIDDEPFSNTGIESWILREQYQRLALVHYKLHLYFNSLVAVKFPIFRPSQFLTPQMMKVRIPCSLELWDSSTVTSSLKGGKSPEEDWIQVESLFSGNTATDSYKRVSEVVAWDFSLGMALGCLLTRQPNESEKASIDRIGPFMFLHLKGLSDA
ncbi:hypothetical protein F4809DRAFT_635655 [Biscogniauxia mediterranea]|nr:hypothetical protein F4809DRAFT_635655 [Biscogniauxia mediterranea]